MAITSPPLRPEELRQLCDRLADPYRAVAEVAYLTGGRVKDLLGLTVDQLSNQQILLGGKDSKLGKAYSVPMTDALSEILGRVKPETGYVFSLNAGNDALKLQLFSHQVRRAAASLGLRSVNVHSLRAARIAHMNSHS